MGSDHADILVVEDNIFDAELALEALRRLGFGDAVQLASDGDEALDYVFGRGRHTDRPITESPRVVLLDLKLLGLSGVEVLRALKQDARTRAIPVVILTSSRELRDLTECYDEGANGYVVKPGNFEQLVQKLRAFSVFWVHVNETPLHPLQPETP